MRVYLSGVKSWYTYFMRGLGRDRRMNGPFPRDATMLEYTFPTFWEEYRTTGDFNRLYKQPGRHTILDSGAHSFFGVFGISVHTNEATSLDIPDPYHYADQYIRFIQHNLDRIHYFIELDVADVYGMDFVWRFRDKVKAAGLLDRMIPAWHPVNGWDDLEWMLDAPSKWIAVEGVRAGIPRLPYGKIIKRAWEKKVRVHGFALLYHEIMTTFPFYSIDCTTWQMPVKYGRMPTFKGNRLVQEVIRDKASQYGKAVNHPWQHLSQADKVTKAITEMKKVETFYTELWKQRGVDWEAHLD